jgi:hypothetical protein
VEAKLREAKTKQLLQEALQELNSIKKGKQYPENMSAAFVERYLASFSSTHSRCYNGATTTIYPAAACQIQGLGASSEKLTYTRTHASSLNIYKTSRRFRPPVSGNYFSTNTNTQNLSVFESPDVRLGSGSTALSNSLFFPPATYHEAIRRTDAFGRPTLSSAGQKRTLENQRQSELPHQDKKAHVEARRFIKLEDEE